MNLGDDWHAALGRMVAAAAELEGNAAYLSVRMTGLSTRRLSHEWRTDWEIELAAPGGVSKTLKAIRERARLLARDEDKATADAWLADVRSRLDDRNRHVHSITVVGITSEPFAPPPVGRLQPRTQALTPAPTIRELTALARDVHRLASEALTIATLVDAEVYARQLSDQRD